MHNLLEFVRDRPEHFAHHPEFEILLSKLIFAFAPVSRLVDYMVRGLQPIRANFLRNMWLALLQWALYGQAAL
jgi:hypothetical protein